MQASENKDSSLLLILRQATAEAHELLHQHPLLKPLLDPQQNHVVLPYVLKGFQAFYSQYENCIHDSLPNKKVPNAPVLGWLEQDQKNYGWEGLQYDNASIPLKTLGHQLGYLYVKQGSTLGGRVILKQLNHNTNFIHNPVSNYFKGYNMRTGTEWQRFTQQFAKMATEAMMHDIVTAATMAFNQINQLFSTIYAQQFVTQSNNTTY